MDALGPKPLPPDGAGIRNCPNKDKLDSSIKGSKTSKVDYIIELRPNFYGIGVNLREFFLMIHKRGRVSQGSCEYR
jgi:hypothetical protein